MKFACLLTALGVAFGLSYRACEIAGVTQPSIAALACVGIGAGVGIVVLLVTWPTNLREIR